MPLALVAQTMVWDLKPEFLSSNLACTSPVPGVVTAPASEGQVRVKSQDPADSSPDGVSRTHVPVLVGLLEPSSLSYLPSLKTVNMGEAPMFVNSGHLM